MTDERGEYRLFWLPPGRYYVSATPQDVRRGWVPVLVKSLDTPSTLYSLLSAPVVSRRLLDNGDVQEEVQVPVYFPGTLDLSAAAPVEVGSGVNHTGFDITVVPPVRTHRIRGVLIDAKTGQPLAGGTVRTSALSMGPSMAGNSGNSDRNGKFEISGVVPGSYLLVGTAEFDGDMVGMAGTVPITVGNSDAENISIAISTGFDIPVRVTSDGQQPARTGGLSFRLVRNPGSVFGGLMMPTAPGSPEPNLLTTNQFTLRGVKLGDYKLLFHSMGGSPTTDPLHGSMPVYVKSITMGPIDVLNGILHVDGPPARRDRDCAWNKRGCRRG
jgi:hypothetical protein